MAEVASSSVSYDLDVKLKVYRRSGVREYIVWRVLDRQIDWFSLKEGEYVPMSVDEAGLYKSEVFPGLWLDPAALVRGDITAVIAALNRGLASTEHAEFLARLKSHWQRSDRRFAGSCTSSPPRTQPIISAIGTRSARRRDPRPRADRRRFQHRACASTSPAGRRS